MVLENGGKKFLDEEIKYHLIQEVRKLREKLGKHEWLSTKFPVSVILPTCWNCLMKKNKILFSVPFIFLLKTNTRTHIQRSR